MKLSTLLRLCVLPAALLSGAYAHGGNVTVSVRNVSNAQGTITAALCDKATFLKRCSAVKTQSASAGTVMLSFPEVAPGRYAVTVYHDENSNRKLDRNLIGMPTEGYGFSRDAPIRMGPPAFDDAAFEVEQDGAAIVISLRY